MTPTQASPSVAPWQGLYGVLALLAAEVFLAVPLHRVLVSFDCWLNWGEAICTPLFASKVSLYTLVPCFVLLSMLLSPERRALTGDAALRRAPPAMQALASVAQSGPACCWAGWPPVWRVLPRWQARWVSCSGLSPAVTAIQPSSWPIWAG